MKISEIAQALKAEVYCSAEKLSNEVSTVFAGDMLSDVLSLGTPPDVLVTGLLNPQVIRTAVMQDSACVIFVRDKAPSALIVTLAEHSNVCVLGTSADMFTACGLLYDGGLEAAQ
ncbi:MAG: hypothetical protein IJE26_05725 [Oscillospiraceae bacterium]|nr:hypothetical protein [Oscillospiraceae bacterium]